MRTYLSLLALAVLAVPQTAYADDVATCGGPTAVGRTCTFVAGGGPVTFQVQNIRVFVTGVLHDDRAEISVWNVTQGRSVGGCSSTTIAAGCGASVNDGGAAGDVLQCTASSAGATGAVYACASLPEVPA